MEEEEDAPWPIRATAVQEATVTTTAWQCPRPQQSFKDEEEEEGKKRTRIGRRRGG